MHHLALVVLFALSSSALSSPAAADPAERRLLRQQADSLAGGYRRALRSLEGITTKPVAEQRTALKQALGALDAVSCPVGGGHRFGPPAQRPLVSFEADVLTSALADIKTHLGDAQQGLGRSDSALSDVRPPKRGHGRDPMYKPGVGSWSPRWQLWHATATILDVLTYHRSLPLALQGRRSAIELRPRATSLVAPRTSHRMPGLARQKQAVRIGGAATDRCKAGGAARRQLCNARALSWIDGKGAPAVTRQARR